MKPLKILLAAAVATAIFPACTKSDTATGITKAGLNPTDFEVVYKGDSTALYTLTNASGMEVGITNFGGRIVSISVPDKDGNFRDVVLGFDSIEAYFPENNQTDFGAAIGRYANRINQGRFTLDGVEYQLPQNNYGHCLHGGPDGWQYRVYDVELVSDSSLVLSLKSPDGDSNFPGNVYATIAYTLSDDNALAIEYNAYAEAPTIINMTNHSYFNLSGDPSKPITDQILTINASNFTPVDSTFMTTGEILPVENTPMDFRNAKIIGADIESTDYEQIKNGKGFDHNWVLDTAGDASVEAASLYCPSTGILLHVYTNEPGIQVYTGNFLDGTVTGKNNIKYNQRTAICLETQHFPDTPNKPEWPSAVLRPGETYHSLCTFKFSTK